MKIIILGSGQVGYSLAENLINENHDITLVDEDASKVNPIAEKLDLRTVIGRCSYPEVLRNAGAEEADMLLAVTDSDEVNMVACQVAYSLFNIGKKIARIRSQHYLIKEELFGSENLPIDVFISPEQLVTRFVQQVIAHPGSLQIFEFGDGSIKMVAVKAYYGGHAIGKTIKEIYESLKDIDFRISMVFRGDKFMVLSMDDDIHLGDEVYFTAHEKHVHIILSVFRRVDDPYHRVMIAGGGGIGGCLAETIQHDYTVKVVDRNRMHCEYLADKLDVTVLHGNACDTDLLCNENIDSVDVFCAVTNDDEDNILACMQAKRLGAKQVMPLITRSAYVDMMHGGPINIAISPQQATVGSILKHLRKGDVLNVYPMHGKISEVMEVRMHGDKKSSKVVGRTVSEIKWPKSIYILAVIRNEELILQFADLVIDDGDHLVVFIGDKKRLLDVGKLFQVSAEYF